MLRSFFDKLFEETVFLILLIALGITLIFRIPSVQVIDWKVIAALWNLMAVAIALEDQQFLDWIANRISTRFHNERSMAFALCATAIGLSMFMTNDVALLTIVPITLLIGKKGNFNPFRLVALETIAANVGSSLTPFGNPQNIFLFNQYQVSVGAFLTISCLFTGAAVLGLSIVCLTIKPTALTFDLEPIFVKSKRKLTVYLALFGIAILSIVHVLPWQGVTALVLVSMVLMDKQLLLQIDYFLLGTFILFFMLVDNLLAIPGLEKTISSYLSSPVQIMWFSALSSQLISNVPSAILFEPFVDNLKPLLIGVSLGGMGTLIASLANLISWKLYIKSFDKQLYFRYFTKLNILLFLGIGLVMSIFL